MIIEAAPQFVDSKVEEGIHNAVCTGVSIFDKTEPDYNDKTQMKVNKKIQFVFHVPGQGPVQSRPMNLKLSQPGAAKRTALSEFIDNWFGAPQTSIDTDSVVGKGAKLMVEHRPGASRTFIDATKAKPLAAKDTPPLPEPGEEVPF